MQNTVDKVEYRHLLAAYRLRFDSLVAEGYQFQTLNEFYRFLRSREDLQTVWEEMEIPAFGYLFLKYVVWDRLDDAFQSIAESLIQDLPLSAADTLSDSVKMADLRGQLPLFG